MMDVPIAAELLLPHRAPMIVIDTLTSVGDGVAEGTAVVRSDSIFAGKDGGVDAVVYVEMIAQMTAAYEAFKEKREGENELKGLFLGARKFEVSGEARVGDVLTIKVSKDAEFSGFAIVQGEVLHGDTMIARGEIKCWHD